MMRFNSKCSFTLAGSLLLTTPLTALTALTVGCGDVAPISVDAVVIQYDTSVQTLCRDCASIGGYYVKNVRDKSYRATVEETFNHTMNPERNRTKERHFKLDAFERRYLGCTPVKSTTGSSCTVNITWKVKTHSEVANLDGTSPARRASLMIGVGKGADLLESSAFFEDVVENPDWANASGTAAPPSPSPEPPNDTPAEAPPKDPAAPPPNLDCKLEGTGAKRIAWEVLLEPLKAAPPPAPQPPAATANEPIVID